MKKKIILGSIMAVSLLILLPSIPAVQYNEVINVNKITYGLSNIDLDSLKVNLENIEINSMKKEDIKSNILEIKNDLENFNYEDSIKELKGQISEDDPQPQLIIITIIILIIIYRIFKTIINTVVGFINNIIDFVRNIINLAELVLYLIQQLSQLMELIQQLIDFINSILNPEPVFC